ncbi:MAG: tetratricopeptide repeat protein [Flavobacteriales bacterium]|nr:tetratricopeptide repeat protein [Flavobacteriales bacterium]
MKKVFFCAHKVVAMLLVLSSCGSGAETEAGGNVAADRIRAMEDTLYATPGVDRKGAQALLDVYLLYAKQHPLDSLTPEYIFRGASLRSTLGDPQGAIELYERIMRDFPGWRKIPDTYYLKAFAIDNGLHQKGEAEKAYQTVIDKFPDHRFAKDAAQMIVNLGYTDEELIQRFEALNADSLQAATQP